jgi:ABC-type multidrug transport system fused ATPase/permease subunit
MQTIKKFLYFLTTQERKSASLLLVMILFMALIDMVGVASILPFMAVLSNPDIIHSNVWLKEIFQFFKTFGIENDQEFLFALGVMIFILLVTSLMFKAITTYVQVRFVQMRQYSISKRLVEGYLNQPYAWFLSRHSADLGKTILSEVSQIVGSGISPLMELIAKSAVVIALIILLFIADPMLAIVISLTFSFAYGLIFIFTRSYLNKMGKERLKCNELRFTAVSEAFGAAKEVKVGGLEQIYIKRFSEPSKTFAKNMASATVIGQLPRFALEALAFGGILIMILYLILKVGSFNSALPIISLYVFAGYRMMPALQQIYSSFTQLTFVGPSLEKLYNDSKSLELLNPNQDKDILSFKNKITLKNINYNYPNSSRTALKDINLEILAKTTNGLVGPTGSGKTTTVDIILGLLEPQKGTLEIDGIVIQKKNSRAWQRSIGYVPQNIYLADDTVAANIAFGVSPKNINLEDVISASKIANLHEFVSNDLPEKYQTTIGERGVRLSGGQRQRIGIARALYYKPKVLILDEATSALDNQTEKAVMDAVNNINKNITIILIAHRLSTVKNCDTIFLLDKGELKDKGTFEELIKNNKNFAISAMGAY